MRPALDVADIFRAHGPALPLAQAGHLSLGQLQVMSAIEACRTAQLGGHVERCEDCDHVRIAYNSCRNRHCPKCQGAAARRWLEAREAELLPLAYYHVVFTLPAPIGDIAFHNKAVVYDILFKAASETLLTIAADPKHLGARIGLTAVLHTWGSALTHHPHAHCIVPGGGLSLDGQSWISCRPGFFLPVRVLSRLFRRLFLDKLAAAHAESRLVFFGDIAEPRRPCDLRRSPGPPAPRRVGGLRQAPLCWTPGRPGLSRPIHPPRRHLRQPPGRLRRQGRHLQVEGLPRRGPGPAQADDPGAGRVHPPLPDPRPAHRLPPHPPLWPLRQHQPRRQPGQGTRAAPAAPTIAGRGRRRTRARHSASQRLSLLRRSHDPHRDLRARRDAQNRADQAGLPDRQLMSIPARPNPSRRPTPPAPRRSRRRPRQDQAQDDPRRLRRRLGRAVASAAPDPPIPQRRPNGLVTRPTRHGGTSDQLKSP